MNQRLRQVLIVAAFFGIPALLTLSLIGSDHAEDAQRGTQPGGVVHGRVLDPEGAALAGVPVVLILDPSEHAGSEDLSGAETATAADGSFTLQAKPVDGRYTVLAGGGIWQHAARAYSFIGRDEKQEFALRVQPGCELEVRFTRDDGGAVGPASYTFEGRAPASWLSLFGQPPLRRKGRIEDGELRIGGLPPMHAQLYVRFDNGHSLELALELEPGHTLKNIQL
ncbi:MAG: carboxypeptidase regulatory-like domain-containing protein [Planctomycetes bacterium]|nr:carboxypeptidase regulatory-like domain-containing protein [Planctomycetota bacterium]